MRTSKVSKGELSKRLYPCIPGLFVILVTIMLIFSPDAFSQQVRKITQKELEDKIAGYWIGQLVGNYLGFPFEGTYLEDAVPVFVDRYYDAMDDSSLMINRNDLRGYCRIMSYWFGGAFSDDDTDIEFVTLHAVEKYGLDINYEEIAEMWKAHINRNIWCANRTARNLMSSGLIPPMTGSRENNENWYQIDPQLVNEIWSVFYPGMTGKSARQAEWGARITNDDWGTHATIAYAVMYSAAFFEKDVDNLVNLAVRYIPDSSPYKSGMLDVIRWHNQFPGWRDCRRLIFDKYYQYEAGGYEAPVSDVSSLANGLFGIMAILYGKGDFVKTVGIAVSAGLDCDNQAATCAGLMGVIHGASSIPSQLTLGMGEQKVWEKPFNNTYFNFTRDGLPVNNLISDIVQRIMKISETAILENGGSIHGTGENKYFLVNSDF